MHHLLMSKIAFRYDLNDPQTITDFKRAITGAIKTITCVDVADIRAVGPNTGMAKAALMRELYHRCDAC